MKNNERFLNFVAIAIGLAGTLLQLIYLFTNSLGIFGNIIMILTGGPIFLLYTISQIFRVELLIIILSFLYVVSSADSLYLVITNARRNWWIAFAILTPFITTIILSIQELQKTGFLQPSLKITPRVQPVNPAYLPMIGWLSSTEIKMQQSAHAAASDDDKSLAHQLMELDRRADIEYESDKEAFNRTLAEVHRIGETLNQRGGKFKMKRVLYRMQALGGQTRWIEGVWNGIGTWMG